LRYGRFAKLAGSCLDLAQGLNKGVGRQKGDANIVPKPMPILSDDPTSTPRDKLAILQTSDEWSAATGYPGPAWPATDEIYNNFIIGDMMAKAATGTMTAEESVKWAAQQCNEIFNKWLHKA
jgi:multiple sugar transport system substrate-binding protein